MSNLFGQQPGGRKWDIESALKNVHAMGRIPEAAEFKSNGKTPRNPGPLPPGSILRKNGRNSHLHNFSRVAAAIVLLIGATYVAINLRNLLWHTPVKDDATTISTGRGEQKQLLLADGTEVTLNSETTLRFSAAFGKTDRTVDLVGEAFFMVAHHKVPFFVRTANGTVEDLSTEFCVEAWPGEHETEVVVKRGNVILRGGISPGNGGLIVHAGEMSTVWHDGILVPPVKAELAVELAWMSGSFKFRETPLRKVIAEFERKYPYSFVVSDRSLLNMKLTASFDREPFDEILKAIMISLDMRYERKGNTIFLFPETKRVERKAKEQRD